MKKILMVLVSLVMFILIASMIITGNGSMERLVNNSGDEIQAFNAENSKEKKQDFDISVYNGEFKIKLLRSKENKIEELNLEDYVLGVVCGEMPAEFPLEALKAQAIAARTYALAHVEAFGGTSNPGANGANLIDTVANQVYYSKDERMQSWAEKKREEYWNKISTAVKETEGQVLIYNGELVKRPYFFSTSSGKTEASIDVFKEDEPYLKSVDSLGEEDSPKFEDRKIITKEYFVETILNKYPKAKIATDNLEGQIEIKDRTEGGAIKSIRVGDQILDGVTLRGLFILNSSNIDIIISGDCVIFATKGYGHGVGMSQWGARVMAKEGSGYVEILSHYYSGTQIKKISWNEDKYIDIN